MPCRCAAHKCPFGWVQRFGEAATPAVCRSDARHEMTLGLSHATGKVTSDRRTMVLCHDQQSTCCACWAAQRLLLSSCSQPGIVARRKFMRVQTEAHQLLLGCRLDQSFQSTAPAVTILPGNHTDQNNETAALLDDETPAPNAKKAGMMLYIHYR